MAGSFEGYGETVKAIGEIAFSWLPAAGRLARCTAAVALVSLVSLSLCAEEIDIAKEALRDGLWDVARAHALRAGESVPESRDVIIESYAREGKWDELLKVLDKSEDLGQERLVYYRALALFESGKADQAREILSGRNFADSSVAKLSARLLARIAVKYDGAKAALKIMQDANATDADEDSEMFVASLMSETGDMAGAERIWQSIAQRGTNASEKAYAAAAVALRDETLLRKAYARSSSAETKRLAGYALGGILLTRKATIDEGVAIVRSLVKNAPDAKGAREGLAAIADAYLVDGRFNDAIAVYRETFDTWPDAAKTSALQDGLGWALSKTGRFDEALEAFVRAEETATTDGERAMEVVKQVDVLAEAGKGDEALLKYRSVLAKYPATESASRIKEIVRIKDLEERGRELYREYRFVEAQAVFRNVGERDSERRPRMQYLEVMCLYGQGLDADKLARKLAAESDDGDVRSAATLWLAKHSYNRGAWAEARSFFSGYAKMAPRAADAPDALVWSARAAFAESDFESAIKTITHLVETYPNSPASIRGFLVQGEALIELARFDEAVLVLERVVLAEDVGSSDRMRARLLGADALFAMGADNPVRYQEALEAYKGVKMGEALDPSQRLSVSYKIAKTLEKLKRTDEAVDRYYSDVVFAYREGRMNGIRFDDEARASFSRAVFRLADEFESRGRDFQAMHVLGLAATSDVPAAAEAQKRIERIRSKGRFL